MPKKLASYVHVDGKPYGPDDDIPPEVADRITTPGAWVNTDDATPEPVVAGDSMITLGSAGETVGKVPSDSPAARNLTDAADEPPEPTAEQLDQLSTDTAEPSVTSEQVLPPRMGGAGSGREEWGAYADSQGVTYSESASRDEIVEALRKAGKPVERTTR